MAESAVAGPHRRPARSRIHPPEKPQLGCSVANSSSIPFVRLRKSAGADLCQPDVERPLAIRPERHEPAVPRNRRAALGSFEVRDAAEDGVFQRVSQRRPQRLKKPHTRNRSSPDERGGDHAENAPPAADLPPALLGGRGRRRRRALRLGVLQFQSGVADVAQSAREILLEASFEQLASGVRGRRPAAQTSPARARECGRRYPWTCRLQTAVARTASRTGHTRTPRCRCACPHRATRLFRAHIGRRSDNPPLGSPTERAGVMDGWRLGTEKHDRFCQPEIEHFRPDVAARRPGHACLLQDDVGRLQITMDDSLFVCSLEGFGDLACHGQRLGDPHCPMLQSIRKRRPFDQFEYQRGQTVRFLQSVNGADVRDDSGWRAAAPHAQNGRDVPRQR